MQKNTGRESSLLSSRIAGYGEEICCSEGCWGLKETVDGSTIIVVNKTSQAIHAGGDVYPGLQACNSIAGQIRSSPCVEFAYRDAESPYRM